MTYLRRRGSFFGIVATITLVAGISFVDSRNELLRELGWFDPPDPLPGYPRIVLWAWERPEDLSFIDTEEVGVAFLAKTIVMEGDAVSIRPRLQPLNIPDGTALMAVARIESKQPALTDLQRTDVVSAVEKMAELPEVRAIQVDFDAVESERGFYGALLRELRSRLPRAIRLSITALASWCIGDMWIKNLPVDEAVPMLFRMGREDVAIRHYLKAGNDFRLDLCRTSHGISTDEPWPALPSGRRVYVFHDRSWTNKETRLVIKRLRDGA